MNKKQAFLGLSAICVFYFDYYFLDIPNPLQVIRYHSLGEKSDILPQDLKISVTADDGTIMRFRYKKYPVKGVQFHPESIRMKPHDMQILKNFLDLKKSV